MNALVLSRRVKEELISKGFGPSLVFVAELAVDCKYYEPGVKSLTPSVLYLNRIVHYKNVYHLIRVFRLLKVRISSARLYVVGCRETRYKSYLKSLAKKLKISDFVEFVRFVNGKLKKQFLQAS